MNPSGIIVHTSLLYCTMQPEEIERVISSLIGNVPLEETGRVVEGFTWKWDKVCMFCFDIGASLLMI